MVKVDIVIASFGELDFLKDLVESIERNTAEDYEIIVVDNCNIPRRVEPIKLYCAENGFKSIFDTNIQGYADALNRGAELGSSEYIVYMDKDMLVNKGWITEMLKVYLTNPNTGVVAPFVRYFDGRPLAEYVKYAGLFEQTQNAYFPSFWKPKVDYIVIPEGEYAVGACYLVRRDLPIKWDRNFIRAYWEDNDFCKQVQHYGKDVVLCLTTNVYHYVNAGHKVAREEGVNIHDFSAKNMQYFIKKWENIHKQNPILASSYPATTDK